VLAALSQSRAAQGASAGDTSRLRDVVQEAAVRAAAAAPHQRAAEGVASLWAAGVDAGRQAGAVHATTYQRSREEVIQRQQQELLELSTPVSSCGTACWRCR
jgi:rsbT co-antagonist protein RsbR